MKILYLYAKRWWDTKMSIGRILYGEAVSRHPGVELRFSGVGWPDWNDGASVAQNIAETGWVPDWIWIYKGEDYPTLRECPIPKVVIFNEANAPKTQVEIEAADATLIGFHHQNDMPRWKHMGRRMFSLPHCCDVDAATGPLSQRPVDCIAAGVRADKIYPLRGRMMDAIASLIVSGMTRKHPGYRLHGNAAIRQQYDDYRQALRCAKVALCCSSIHRYPLAKYVESAAAGCLVIGDMPDDDAFRATIGQHIVEVPADASVGDIAEIVASWLERPAEAQERASGGQRCVRDRLTLPHYADRLVKVLADLPGDQRIDDIETEAD